jgi:two-component system, chemotaxis family, protein-glutamate methylesterase/glutaminase
MELNRIIVIGSSAGGVETIPRLLSYLPSDLPAAIFVTLHIPPFLKSLLPQIIQRQGRLPAIHPRNHSKFSPGKIFVAPPDFHLMLSDGKINLSHGPRENNHRPAIDALFRSAAIEHEQRVIGVLLTGTLADGVAGLQEIKTRSGVTIVQDPEEALFPEMPMNALQDVEIDHCLPIAEIAKLLTKLANEPISAKGGNIKGKKEAPSTQSPNTTGLRPDAVPFPLVCPECQGPLWESAQGGLTRYQCLVGHRYTSENILSAQGEELERSLWVALRTLEERVNLQKRLAGKAKEAGQRQSERSFLSRAKENQRHARALRQLLEENRGTA